METNATMKRISSSRSELKDSPGYEKPVLFPSRLARTTLRGSRTDDRFPYKQLLALGAGLLVGSGTGLIKSQARRRFVSLAGGISGGKYGLISALR